MCATHSNVSFWFRNFKSFLEKKTLNSNLIELIDNIIGERLYFKLLISICNQIIESITYNIFI